MSGLESLDEGDFVRYIAGTKDASSPDVFGGVKRLKPAEKSKYLKQSKQSRHQRHSTYARPSA